MSIGAGSETPSQRIESLYLHVPFCAQKCHYCAFFSQQPSGDLMEQFVAAVIAELGMVAEDLCPRTIFVGGGTPSLLNLRQWRQLFAAMDRLGLLGAAEFTVECNPATLSEDKARCLREHGVNRISMGVQSLDEGLLERLGRVHDRAMVFRSYDILRRAGFGNINVDLMFAIPGQTLEVWARTLAEALALESEHLSCYEVIYEEDTVLFEQLRAGRFDTDEALACRMYDELVERAETRGLTRYEIANFARGPLNEAGAGRGVPARACLHNVNYWRGGGFYGIGPSATGYVRGMRTRNWANTALYCDRIGKGARAIESREQLSSRGRAGETAAFGLRMTRGWEFEEFSAATGFDLREEWGGEMQTLVAAGRGELGREGFRLTPAGLRFADAAAAMFLRE